ncbi:unnamed protein product [Periconia digitata]|uniref:Zn(2)-C6 fungal-type domain-containing protein n=1 Tax=Periconia digitata TaxID=1303443 RepID=A0A9W4XN43_9PLEO|nr:unnamed protein product [Periconia digitata]
MNVPKKTRACVPCHTRKVRCDASQVGTPCSRCVDRACVEACVPSPRPQKRIRVEPPESPPLISQLAAFRGHPEAFATGRQITTPGAALQVDEELEVINNTNVGADENQSIQRGAREQTTTTDHSDQENSAQGEPNTARDDAAAPRKFFIEYYKEFNPCTIVGDLLGRPRRQGLVYTENTVTMSQSAKERELSKLDQVDRSYLHQRDVHDMPENAICASLIRNFFRYVYVHIPVIDPADFVEQDKQKTCSSILLYAIFMNALPFASNEDIQSMGFTNILAGQTEFFTRAKVLYDFGCEKNELKLLQSFLLLASHQHSLDLNRDSRFWFGNAVRLALQMGLHKSAIESEVDPATYKLCRRIWWFIKQHDVFSVLSGLESTQKIIDEDTDTSTLTLGNFSTNNTEPSPHPQDDVVAKHYFIELCKLSHIGSDFLHLVRCPTSSSSAPQNLENKISTWRAKLPPELSATHLLSSGIDIPAKSCIITLHMSAFQLEVMLYRSILRSSNDVNSNDPTKTKLDAAVLEGVALWRKGIAVDVVKGAPAFLNEFIAQLLAIQTETLQANSHITNSSNNGARALGFQADLYVFVAYFEEFENRWPTAVKYSHLFRRGVFEGLG